MPGKKHLPSKSFKMKAVPFIQNFFEICDPNSSMQTWKLDSFGKSMGSEIFNKFISYFKDYSTEGGIDYTILIKEFDNWVSTKQKTHNALVYQEIGNEIDFSYRAGLYKTRLWIVILTKVLPNISLNVKEKDKFKQEILHELFRHLPACLEIAIKAYTSLEADTVRYRTIIELLSFYETYLPIYLNTASNLYLAARSIRILSALEKGGEFYLMQRNIEKSEAIEAHLEQVHVKADAIIKTMMPSELRNTLTQYVTQSKVLHKLTKEKLLNNPWVSLFHIYQNVWVNQQQGIGEVDFQAKAPVLLALLEEGSVQSQTAFIEGFSTLLKQFNTLSKNGITPETIACYIEFVRLVVKTCHDKNFPQDQSVAFVIRGLIARISDDMDLSSPITIKLHSCLEILMEQPNHEVVNNYEKFIQDCTSLKNDYETYISSNPRYYHTSRHLALVTRLEALIIDFKTFTDEELEKSANALFRLSISIMKHFNDTQYHRISKELLSKLKQAKQTPAKNTCIEPLVEPTIENVLDPLLKQDDVTPVLSAEQSPEISPAITPPIEPLTQSVVGLSKAQVDEKVNLLVEQLKQTYLSQEEEQRQGNKSEINAYEKLLEQRLSAAQLAHGRRLKSQKEKNEKALAEAKKALDAQYEKKLQKVQRKNAKELEKINKQFMTEREALPYKVKETHQDRMAQIKKAHELAIAQQQTRNSTELASYRHKLESGLDMSIKALETDFKARAHQLQVDFETAKETISKEILEACSNEYDVHLQAQHEANLAELASLQTKIASESKMRYQAELDKMQHSMQGAKTAILVQAHISRKVALPVSVINIMKQFSGNSTRPLLLSEYYRAIDSIFISPDYSNNFNLIYNLGLLNSIFPTLPENYSLIIEKQLPLILEFWKNELEELNNTPKHSAYLVALFLMLPILANSQTESINEHVQSYINQFIDHFQLEDTADKYAFNKTLESILLGNNVDVAAGIPAMRTIGLYIKYRVYEQNLRDDTEQSILRLNRSKGYHVKYKSTPPMIIKGSRIRPQ